MLRRAALLPFLVIVSCAEPIDPGDVILPMRDARAEATGNAPVDTGAPDEELGDSAEPGVDSETPSSDTGSGTVDTGIGSAPDTSVVDTGTAPIDTGTAVVDTGTAPVDTGVADTGTPPTDTSTGAGTTVTFPIFTDTFNIFDDPWMWQKGDYIQGGRTTTVSSITSISGSVGMDNRLATCGTLDVAVKINSTTVGTMKITSTTGLKYPMAFTFTAIAGPKYTLRYEALNTVAAGCGSIWIDEDVTKLTIK
jgi:hypothetical protein